MTTTLSILANKWHRQIIIKIITASPTTWEVSAHKLIKVTATATATLNLTKQEISKIL